jgi:membrane protease YdiL (CAAX protease family)
MAGAAALSLKQRLWLALAPAVLLPFLVSLVYIIVLNGTWYGRALYGLTKLFILAWPLLALRFILADAPPWRAFPWKKHLKAVPLGLLAGAGVAALLWLALLTPLGEVVSRSAESMRVQAAAMGILEHYWAFALFLAFFNSLAEEYYWRWFLYGRLRAVLGVLPSLLLASAAFALHHVVVMSQLVPGLWGVVLGACVGLGGALWCLLYEAQGSVAGAWACHLLVDLAVMGIGYRTIF